MSKFDRVWRSLEATVASGWAPGIVAGARHDGETEIFATGAYAFDSDRPMQPDTPFRIASLSKMIAGALAASMIADGTIGLDDPVEEWLPELANPRVLVRPDAQLDQTVPAKGPITVRHLLTSTMGHGVSFADTPLAAEVSQFAYGPIPPRMTAHEYLGRLSALPLAHQPGERWMYHTSADILSILITRAAGRPLHEVVNARITGPLGMRSTGFFTDAQLPTSYRPTPGGLVVFDEYDFGFSRPPQFQSLAGGLVSTVPDFLAFLIALADDTLLPAEIGDQLKSDQLSPGQRIGMTEMAGPTRSWGWQLSIQTANDEPWTEPGRYGWTGGAGTSAFVDPARDLIGVVLTQRFMAGPNESFAYFWEPLAVVAAI